MPWISIDDRMHKLKYEEFSHLTENVLKKLTQNRITTILEFLEEDVSKLTALTNLSLPQILTVRSEIFSKYSAPLASGSDILTKSLTRISKISTGIESLDSITSGGIPVGNITEICGLADSGKTQLSLQLSINCVKSKNNVVLYVDTKGDFSAIRLQKLLEANNYSHKDMAVIMYKIRVVHVWVMEELIDLFKMLKDKTLNIENLALIIVDSLPCLMFQYLGDDNKVGLSFLNTLVNYSRYLSKELNVGVIYVNIQTRWLGTDAPDLDENDETTTYAEHTFVEKRNRCLGKYWNHIPVLILELRKVEDNSNDRTQIKVLVTNCNNLKTESGQCTLNLNGAGIKQ